MTFYHPDVKEGHAVVKRLKAGGVAEVGATRDFIRTSMIDKCLGSMKITTHVDRKNRCKIASGTNW